MQVPDKFWKKFENKELSQEGSNGPFSSREEMDHTRAALAMCENIDWNIGRILDQLNTHKLRENTIIIFLSDNGPNGYRWNSGMKGIKGSTDEGGVRSPLSISWKGKISGGRVINEIASSIDLLPTLKDLVGINQKPRKQLDGISLKPLLLDENIKWNNRLIFNYWKGKLSVRSQNYRLDKENKLFNMAKDPNQKVDVSKENKKILKKLLIAKEKWKKEVLSKLPEKDKRPFLIGHPSLNTTQIPARDGIADGEIKRSNRHPNCTFFTNWINIDDKIIWKAEVPVAGNFEVIVYYSCNEDAVGSEFEISFNKSRLKGSILEAHNPKEYGAENDRSLRTESYVKDFKPLKIGEIKLEKGKGNLIVKGLKKTGKSLMELRLILFKRI